MFDREMRYLAVSRRWMADYHLETETLEADPITTFSPSISEEWKACIAAPWRAKPCELTRTALCGRMALSNGCGGM